MNPRGVDKKSIIFDAQEDSRWQQLQEEKEQASEHKDTVGQGTQREDKETSRRFEDFGKGFAQSNRQKEDSGRMKRGRGDQLTGGSGDVSPQIFTQTINLSAANTFTQVESGLPQIRIPTRKGKSIVMELLWAHIIHPQLDTQPAAGGTAAVSQWQLGTISEAAINFGDPRVLAVSELSWRGAFTAAGSFESVANMTDKIQFHDGAGHGLLVATDSLFMAANTANFTGAATFFAKIAYRFKEVTLEEYIGIVQSQQ